MNCGSVSAVPIACFSCAAVLAYATGQLHTCMYFDDAHNACNCARKTKTNKTKTKPFGRNMLNRDMHALLIYKTKTRQKLFSLLSFEN